MVGLTLGAAVILYFTAFAVQGVYLRRLEGRLSVVARRAALVGLGLHGLGVAGIIVQQGVGTLATMRLAPSVVALALMGVSFLPRAWDRFWVMGTFVAPVAAVILAATVAAGAAPATYVGTVPKPDGGPHDAVALTHIAGIVAGSFGFFLSFVLAALYVEQDVRLRTKTLPAGKLRIPPLQTLERFMYRILAAGFLLYSVGVAAGTAWAVRADGGVVFQPYYTLSILAWLSFAFVIGMRLITGWTGRRAAILVAIGFIMNLAVAMAYHFRAA